MADLGNDDDGNDDFPFFCLMLSSMVMNFLVTRLMNMSNLLTVKLADFMMFSPMCLKSATMLLMLKQ